ncbi:MAG: hypothetical protein FWG10_05730 [Eubacteriaceae bacterium]|nr:hypothetical protein [Eubacteriaceae bacterium]
MAYSKEELKLIRMNEIEATAKLVVVSLYPIQKYSQTGRSRRWKDNVVLAIAAAITTGAAVPESTTAAEPMTVISQTAEENLQISPADWEKGT